MKIKAFPILLLVGLIPWLMVSLSGQEPAETAPDTTITEEATTATPEATAASQQRTVFPTADLRYLSAEDLEEMQGAQATLAGANTIFQYVLNRIIVDYGIDTQAEVLNILTGSITPRFDPVIVGPAEAITTTTQ